MKPPDKPDHFSFEKDLGPDGPYMMEREQIERLKSIILEKERKIEALNNDNAELTSRLNEIYISKAWKLASFLLKIRLFLAPHNSLVGKTVGKMLYRLTNLVSFLKRIHVLQNYERYEQQLASILEAHKDCRDIIIFAPSVSWNIALFQRPQHLALHFARYDILTLYVEPPNSSREKVGFREIQKNLYLCKVPLDVFKAIDSPAVVFLSYNKKLLSHFTNPRIIYEYIDELSVFPGNFLQLKKDHQEYLQIAHIVTATAGRLYDQVVQTRPDALLVMNGVNYEHFHKTSSESVQVPEDFLPYVKKGKPIVGYYGALAKWFDYELLKEVAKARPDLTFILIGPAYDNSMAESGIDAVPNIHWLGVKDYRILPNYLYYFDVAMIPFQLNSITHSTSPLKLYEFMAGNKPVVITPMNESMRTDGVLVASTVQEFSAKIDEGLKLRSDPEYIRRIDQAAQENTWDQRCRQILDALVKQG